MIFLAHVLRALTQAAGREKIRRVFSIHPYGLFSTGAQGWLQLPEHESNPKNRDNPRKTNLQTSDSHPLAIGCASSKGFFDNPPSEADWHVKSHSKMLTNFHRKFQKCEQQLYSFGPIECFMKEQPVA
eukprot:sb/3475414/